MEATGLSSPAPAVHSYARQAAQIPEIRDLICESVNFPDRTLVENKRTRDTDACAALACLLRTSHGFFASAVRWLWGTREINAQDILVLLPGVTKERWRASSVVRAIVTTGLSEPLPDARLARFNLYAPLVKRLNFMLVLFARRSAYELSGIQSRAQKSPLFPNLHSISTRGQQFLRSDESANGLLDWLEILASPSIRTLDLLHVLNRDSFSQQVIDRFNQLIERYVTRCPDLSTLSYFYGGPPARHYPTFLAAHAIVPTNLENLRCRYAVFCPELLAWLAQMSHLRRLEFDALDGFHSTFANTEQSITFSPSLDHLVLRNCWVGPTMQLFQSLLSHNLITLSLKITANEGWYPDPILRLCQQLVESCPKLTDLSLDCRPSQLSSQSLHVLQPLALRKLSAPHTTRRVLGGARAIQDLLRLWPSLSILDLPSYNASFEDLAHIIPFGPSLSTLRLGIEINIPCGISNTNLSPVPPSQSSVDKRQSLTLVSSYDYPRDSYEVQELNELARYLSSMRPCISFWMCSDDQWPWVFRRFAWLKSLNAELDKLSEAYLRDYAKQV